MNTDIPQDNHPHTVPVNASPSKDWREASDDEIFDADIFVAMGMDTTPDEEKKEMLERMTTTIQKAVASKLLDQLNPDQKEQLKQIMAAQDINKINEFLLVNVSDFPEITRRETIKLKRALLTGEMPTG